MTAETVKGGLATGLVIAGAIIIFLLGLDAGRWQAGNSCLLMGKFTYEGQVFVCEKQP